MAKISKECIGEALKGLQHFNANDLQTYVQDVFNRAKKYDNMPSARAFDTAVKEINNESLQSFFEDASIKANNTSKYDKNVDRLKSGKTDMRSLLIKRYTNLGDNVSSAQWSAKSRLTRKAFDALSRDEIEFLEKSDNQYLIADEMDGRKTGNSMAEKIAKQLQDYIEYRKSELIISNAMRQDEMRNDRNLRYIHNSEKMLRGGQSWINAVKSEAKYDMSHSKPLWKEAIKKHFNMEGTFENTDALNLDGTIDWAKADKMLDNIFDNITTGKSEIFTRSSVTNDREAVARKSRMFFKPKSMRDFVEYNKLYGQGDLYSAWISDIQASGNKIGMAELWGDSPYNMYIDLKTESQKIKTKDEGWWDHTDNYFNTVLNLDKSAKSPSLANFGANLRTLTSMARLTKVALQSISDIGYTAAFAQRIGVGYWRAWVNQIGHIFDTFPTEERIRIAKLNKLSVDSHLGYIGRWVDSNNSSQVLSKISTHYFRKIGLEALDRGNKVGTMHMMSKHLFENSTKSLEQLDPSLKKWVEKFMDGKEWDLLRTKSKDQLFTVENAEAITDAEFRAHFETTDKKVPLYQMRNNFIRKVDAMFQVSAENAVLSPTEFERAWLFQGARPGTVKGELLRTLTQFKAYTLAYMDRVLVQGWKDADTAQQKLAWATSMMMGTIPLSVLSVYLNNISNGVSMPDWSQMNVPDREKFLVELIAPSLAIFNGMLDPMNQNSNMFLNFIASPSTRLISESLATAGALVTGDPKRSLKHLKKVANYMLPIQSIPFASPFIREAFGDEAHLQPGQKILYGA